MSVEIENALRRKYAPPEYVFFREFAMFDGGRRLDGVAVSPWAARGYKIIGFEIKTRRPDWLKELRQPAKAAEGSAYCDLWFVVATSGVVTKDEVPAGWGFLELRGERLFKITAAEPREAVPIDRAFMARCIGKLSEAAQKAKTEERWEIEQAIRAQLEEERKRAVKREKDLSADEIAGLRHTIKSFEEASGLDLSAHKYEIPRVGALVRALLKKEMSLPNLEYQKKQLELALAGVTEAHDAIQLLDSDASAPGRAEWPEDLRVREFPR